MCLNRRSLWRRCRLRSGGWKHGGSAAFVLLLGLGLAAPLQAGEVQDRLFVTGVLASVPAGHRLVFSHSRGGGFDSARLPPIEDGEMVVTLTRTAADAGGREVSVTASDAAGGRPLLTMPVSAGHPLLLIFLESTVRNIAKLTGGSPFYIHNRIRDALAAADRMEPLEVMVAASREAGERLVLRPFAGDPNLSELGDFARLEIRVTLSDAVPGGIARLEANAAPAFFENIDFERLEGE